MTILDITRFILYHPLSRGRAIEKLFRFVTWQIGARLVPGPVAVNFVNSARLLLAPGLTGGTGNVYVGLHEFEEMALVLHFLRPEDFFVDIGANVGAFTILAAACIGTQCVAFEPDRAAFSWLLDNIHLNKVSDLVEARREAVGDRCGETILTTGLDTMNRVVDGDTERRVESQLVSIITLDQALVGHSPTMLKIDVEGFEAAVIHGASRTLRDPHLHCVIMELLSNQVSLRSLMKDFGFGQYSYDPFTRMLKPQGEGNARNNGIFIRDATFVQNRLHGSPRFTVQNTRL